MMQQIDYISAIVFSSDYNNWMTQPLEEINAWLDQKGIQIYVSKEFCIT
jgi:hypothetical protein